MSADLGATTYTSVTWTAGDVITEAKLDNMVANDQAYDSHAAQGLLLNNAKSYGAKDSSGNNKNLAEINASDQLKFGDSGLTFDTTNGMIKDEDDMASNSATALATQQSIKAYSDLKGIGIYRQAIINGNFDVWQRGTSGSSWTAGTFYSDRWRHGGAVDGGTNPTLAISQQALTPGDIAGAYYHYRVNVDGAGSGYGDGAILLIGNRIEHGTRYLCGNGKKVTVSFWARSSIANKKLGIHLSQNYGSGGTPTSQEDINGTHFDLTSSWVKYTHTFTTNTLAGKTFGSNNNDHLEMGFDFVWGSTYQSLVGDDAAETFVGAGNIDIAQVQLCAGDVALPFQPKSYEDELRACQRYCFAVTTTAAYEVIGMGTATAGTTADCTVFLPVKMRTTPALTATAADFAITDFYSYTVDCTNLALSAKTGTQTAVITGTVAAGLTTGRPAGLVSDVTTGRLFILSAEL